VVLASNLERKVLVIENIVDENNEQTNYVISFKTEFDFIKETAFSS
jgi:hypothetical protein